MKDRAAGHSVAHLIDRRVCYALRRLEAFWSHLEDERELLPETADIAGRFGLSVFHFVRLFADQVGSSPSDDGRGTMMKHAASRLRCGGEAIGVAARDFAATPNRPRSTRPSRAITARPRLAGAGEPRLDPSPRRARAVRLKRLPWRTCFARRHRGPREFTGARWADVLDRSSPGLRKRPRVGFACDDPRVTPPERIRHDRSTTVEAAATLPDDLIENGFEVLRSPAGLWIMVDRGRRRT